ncbi:MAG: hypothetical protein H0U40_08950 [Chloroflexia bacterium]|nr:hypothetical protein [Chloroflexia bacterium]MDQ3513042.1 hypothetical protein [Chloroflexota bacterium]
MATVRVGPGLHATLRALSAAEQRPIGQIIEEAVDRYQWETFWTAMHEGFARLRADPDAWDEYQTEAAIWDSMAADGLEGEGPYFSGEVARDELAATVTTTTR